LVNSSDQALSLADRSGVGSLASGALVARSEAASERRWVFVHRTIARPDRAREAMTMCATS
jgi:hypothetical protein